jgi:excisionase family DNA binding protein
MSGSSSSVQSPVGSGTYTSSESGFAGISEDSIRLLFTVEDVARALNIGRTRVFGLIANGILPSVNIGRSRRIRRRDIEAYVDSLDVAS